MENDNLPKFVKLGHTALRLIGDRYYRDGGCWEINYKIIDGELVSWAWGRDLPHLHKRPLIEISEEEWREDNGQYAPDFNESMTGEDCCPECGSPLKPKMSGVECTRCTYWFCY